MTRGFQAAPFLTFSPLHLQSSPDSCNVFFRPELRHCPYGHNRRRFRSGRFPTVLVSKKDTKFTNIRIDIC
ncbi:hypothetical protein MLD38_016697 [Melastoma candidum]|uniref:Uncharacterized protein n=1 Tax=Melastoma candidum TaxID=119954 RepID=A0ACB9QMM8_9MYRT|nr:hypothetical protein MLD38_016697 [Melastoma candidum]